MKKLLLISNSTMIGEDYLHFTLPYLQKFLGKDSQNILFIPYAAVMFSYDEYEEKVNNALCSINITLTSIHHSTNFLADLEKATAIVVGGGNTFALLKKLQEQRLIDVISNKVKNGTPYIGWSAGANLACPSIKTTNDMPITQPTSFDALQLINYQINPHFLDKHPKGHGGESREDRINEFLKLNQQTKVIGLREGTMLWMENQQTTLYGEKPCKVFTYGEPPTEKEGTLSI